MLSSLRQIWWRKFFQFPTFIVWLLIGFSSQHYSLFFVGLSSFHFHLGYRSSLSLKLSHTVLISHFLESFNLHNKFLRQCDKILRDFLIEWRVESCSDELEDEEGDTGHGCDHHRLPQEVN